MCSDSEFIYSGGFKSTRSKIYHYFSPSCRVLFVLSGCECNARQAIDWCKDRIDSIPVNQQTYKQVKTVIENAMVEVYDRYVYNVPSEFQPDHLFQLIIGIKTEGMPRAKLLSTDYATVTECDSMVCSGAGTHFFEYLTQSLYRPDIDHESTFLACVYGLHEAKANIQTCGGRSVFAFLSDNGQINMADGYAINELDKAIQEFGLYVLNLRGAVFRESTSEESLESALTTCLILTDQALSVKLKAGV